LLTSDFTTMAATLAATSFLVGFHPRGRPGRMARPPSFLLFPLLFLTLTGCGAAPATADLCAPSRKSGRKQAKNRLNETILTEPRNDPETHAA
jgi:hypothetical protein